VRSLVKKRHRGSACSGSGDRDVGGFAGVDGSDVGDVVVGGAPLLGGSALLGGAPLPDGAGEQPARPMTAKEVIMIPAAARPPPSDKAPTAGERSPSGR
jgi:hypothetical protein